MIIYTAGLYSKGNIDDNIEVARKCAIDLWERGFTVICPHLNTAHFEVDCKVGYEDYMRGDLEIIARCDAVVMLPNWELSEGAKQEKQFAISRDIPIYYYGDILPHISDTEILRPKQCASFIDKVMRMYRVHNSKNSDYSPANVAATGMIGLVTRMWDKIARLMNLTGFKIEIAKSTFVAPSNPKHESIDDTIMDLSVYSIITMIYKEGNWGK